MQLMPPMPEKQVFSPRMCAASASASAPTTQCPICQFAPICPPPKGPVAWVSSPKPATFMSPPGAMVDANGSDQRLSLKPPPKCPPIYNPLQLIHSGAASGALDRMAAPVIGDGSGESPQR